MLASYVAEAESILASLRPRIESLDSLPAQRAPASKAIDEDLAQLDSVARLLDIELRRGDGGADGARGRCAALHKKFVRLTPRCQSNVERNQNDEGCAARATPHWLTRNIARAERKQRSDLLANEGADGSETRSYHARFKNTTSRLQASSEILNESRRNIVDTEANAAGIAEKLLENRQTIESAHSKLMETGTHTRRAHALTTTRAYTTRRTAR